MSSRHRSRAVLGGISEHLYVEGGSVPSTTPWFKYHEVCDDVVGNYPRVNPYYNKQVIKRYDGINGTIHPYGLTVHYKNYVETFCLLADLGHSTDDLDPFNLDELATRLWARTNPSRPVASVPQFIGELKDLPGLIQTKGRNLADSAGSGYLAYQFGWVPLIRDLQNFMDATGIISRRVNELSRLHSKGGLKRSLKMGLSTSTKTTNEVFNSEFFSSSGRSERKTTQTIWGSIRWIPDHSPPSTDMERRKQARDAVFALHATPINALSTAWELLPWSWLVDWSANVGEYLTARQNVVGAHAVDACIMRKLVTSRKDMRSGALPAGLTGGDGGTQTLIEKFRFPVSGPTLTATFPVLNGYRLSILSALFAQRSR
nr:MAG: putative maturation protein [Leviviridae sp.]